MKKANRKNNNESISPSALKHSYKGYLNESKKTYSYRPSGEDSSDGLELPDCGSSVQNIKKNK